MRFFTRGWATGELTDEEYEAAIPAYAAHLAALALPQDVQKLAETPLHDGILEELEFDASGLYLSFVTGNLQTGYFSTRITYSAFEVVPATIEKLKRFATNRRVELLYDEIDRESDAFAHRILFSTHEDLAIRFESVGVSQSPRPTREIAEQ